MSRCYWIVNNKPKGPPKFSARQKVTLLGSPTVYRVKAMQRGFLSAKNLDSPDSHCVWPILEGEPFARDEYGFYMLESASAVRFAHETELEAVSC